MKPSVTREICGTESGYRKHRRMGEKRCKPCTDAHNIMRRDTYKPDKNRQYASKYKEKPEVQEKIKEYGKRYDPALGRAMTDDEIVLKQERQLQKKKDKQEQKERKKLLNKILKLINKRIELLERRASVKHGTTYAETNRCRRAFGAYCDLCKPILAKYNKDRYHKNLEESRAKRRAYKKRVGHPDSNRIRARKKGVKYEHYNRQHIFDRDGYDCYLCHTPVDLNANPIMYREGWELYPHVEHVIPLSRGGTDTLDNVRIAHAKCNMDKGTLTLEELNLRSTTANP